MPKYYTLARDFGNAWIVRDSDGAIATAQSPGFDPQAWRLNPALHVAAPFGRTKRLGYLPGALPALLAALASGSMRIRFGNRKPRLFTEDADHGTRRVNVSPALAYVYETPAHVVAALGARLANARSA